MARSGSDALRGQLFMLQSCGGVGSACLEGRKHAGGVGLKAGGRRLAKDVAGFGGVGYLTGPRTMPDVGIM